MSNNLVDSMTQEKWTNICNDKHIEHGSPGNEEWSISPILCCAETRSRVGLSLLVCIPEPVSPHKNYATFLEKNTTS